MKINKKNKETRSIDVVFSKFPMDGNDTMTITEWESGDGVDIKTSEASIELTWEETKAIIFGVTRMTMLGFSEGEI